MIRLSAFSDEAGVSLQEQIDALHRNNIRFMEIRTVDGESIAKRTEEEARQIASALKENNIAVWAIGSPLGKVHLDDSFELSALLEQTHHLCRLANILETDKIRMFSFYSAYDKKEQVFDYLRRMQKIAESYGVLLCHENEKDIYGDVISRVQELMENVPGLKFVYDPANYLQCGEAAADSLRAFHAVSEYFHIKDILSETQELVPAGCGDGDIAKLIGMITDDKVLTLEPHLMVFDGYASFDRETMKNKFHFASNGEAFDAGVKALKELLIAQGYTEKDGGFVK